MKTIDKKAAVSPAITDALVQGVKDWAAKHPVAAGRLKLGAGITGAFGAGGLAGLSWKNWRTGKATFGEPSDSYQQGSYLNTFNPLSSVFGGVDKVPASFMKLFPDTTEGKSTAHMVFKSGAVGLLAAALVGGYRAAKHTDEMEALEDADRPAKNLAGQLSTTFSGDLMTKKKKKQDKKASTGGRIRSPGIFTWQNFFGTAIPMGAALLASSLAYNAADSYYDKKRNEALDKAIAAKETAIKQLIATRARMAKGLGTEQELAEATKDIDDKDVYIKGASLNKQALFGANDLVQHFGATTAAIILASALGSYAYTSASDENNIKYKAYKKALREYAKNKSGITPITIMPTDSKDYFEYIDGSDDAAKKKEQPVRALPELDVDSLNKPISVSF